MIIYLNDLGKVFVPVGIEKFKSKSFNTPTFLLCSPFHLVYVYVWIDVHFFDKRMEINLHLSFPLLVCIINFLSLYKQLF